MVPKISVGNTVGSNAKVARPVTAGGVVTGCDSGDPAAACSDLAQIHATHNPNGIKNPGFPFWLAGVESTVGQRMPTPPLDMDPDAGGFDGGLPRHSLDGYAASGCATVDATAVAATRASVQSSIDMTKELHNAKPVWFEEGGTDLEKAAMAFHAVRNHPSTATLVGGSTVPGSFVTNGSGRPDAGRPLPRAVRGRPGQPAPRWLHRLVLRPPRRHRHTGSSTFNADNPRIYKGANIQFDVVLNKLGYHYPQERILTLWEDAVPTITKARLRSRWCSA